MGLAPSSGCLGIFSTRSNSSVNPDIPQPKFFDARALSSPAPSLWFLSRVALACARNDGLWRLSRLQEALQAHFSGCTVGHGVPKEGACRCRIAGRGSGLGVRAVCPRDPGRAAEAGDTEGDTGEASSAQGRGGQDPGAAAVHAAGGSGHAGERGLEEELDGPRRWRWEIGVNGDLPSWSQESEAALLRGPAGSPNQG